VPKVDNPKHIPKVAEMKLLFKPFCIELRKLMGTWVMDLPSGGVTFDLVEMSHRRSGFQSTRLEPRNHSTTSPLLFNRALCD
jgi:hypothetical protein